MATLVRVTRRPKVEIEHVEQTPFVSRVRTIKKKERIQLEQNSAQMSVQIKPAAGESLIKQIQAKLGISSEYWRKTQDREFDAAAAFLRG